MRAACILAAPSLSLLLLAGASGEEGTECATGIINSNNENSAAATCSSTSAGGGDDDGSETSPPTGGPKCGFYIAPSSIPGAGLGLYSASAHPKGATIGFPDINIALVNKRRSVLENYEWDASSMASTFEGREVSNIAPGFGMLANGHYELDNVALGLPHWDDAGLHRSASPSAGSFTLMHNMSAEATKDIPAGSELFLNYGRAYFQDRPEYRGKVFSAAEFAFADRLNNNLASFAEKHSSEMTSQVETKTMKLVRSMLSAIPDLVESTKLVPDSLEEVRRVAQVGTARNQFPDSIRTLEWLETNGSCADNLRAGMSSKPERGRGALATRPIRKGDVVAASPLLHLFESQLEYDIDVDGDQSTGEEQRTERYKRKRLQLFYNYCFGHPESPLVLFPYAPLVGLINHDSDQANVEVRWAADEVQPEWWRRGRKGDVITKDGRRFGGTGMMIEYIASRDIAAGEEVTMKYGAHWESAWEKHVTGWTAMPGSEDYTDAYNLNEGEANRVVRTTEEQMTEPYPSNIMTACYVEWWRDYNEFEDIGEDGVADDTEEIQFEWNADEFLFYGFHSVRPCKVLQRFERDDVDEHDVYSVQIFNKPQQHAESKVETFEKVVVVNVPRQAIVFVDKLYSTDHYLESAFRHTIDFPDEFWPMEWKARKNA